MSDAAIQYAMPRQPNRASPALSAQLIIAMIALRWFAGILENFGVPSVSEAAAMALLATLGFLTLTQMRLARETTLLTVGLLAWVFTGTLSLAASDVPNLNASLSLLALLLLYALAANAAFLNLKNPAQLPTLRMFLATFITVGAALAFLQILTDTGFVENEYQQTARAFGSDVHPVSFAIQIVAAMAALECIRLKSNTRLGPIHVAILALGLIALYLTYARTAWVLAVVCLVAATLSRFGPALRLGMLAILIPAAILALLASDRFADLESLPFFLSNFSFENVVFDYRYIDNSVSWRIVNWALGFQQALEQPLLGHGPGQSAAASYFHLEMHNILLEIFFEGGIVGLIAFSVVLIGLIRTHWTLPKSTTSDRRARTLTNSFGIGLLLAVLFSTSLVDQLMTFLIYILLLVSAATPAKEPSL